MLDINVIREQKALVVKKLAQKNVTVDIEDVVRQDQKRRDLLQEAEHLRALRNETSIEIGHLIKEGKDAEAKKTEMKTCASRISSLEEEIRAVEGRLHQMLLAIPNLAHDSVPVGGAEKNQVVRHWGEKRQFDFAPKDHVALAESLDIIDFKRATKLSGTNFILFKGAGAQLERALYNFMLDLHTTRHGYKEIFPPFLVNSATMTGTGQLPKMAEDMYKVQDEDLYLIPTAEVPVTNIHRDEIIPKEQLPVYYTAYTACFRKEAGSYGKETKGLVRVHQFDKVELVKFVEPENSYDELERLVGNAEVIFQMLGLPYRVLMLASGDLSFAAAKCYDIEAHAPGMDRWLEVSSCSNFEDFQARRANIRFKGGDMKKPQFVHTLNGSGVALARTVVAILENYQTAEGQVIIPEVLRPYLGGKERIS